MFNSYVKLPEGTPNDSAELPELPRAVHSVTMRLLSKNSIVLHRQ